MSVIALVKKEDRKEFLKRVLKAKEDFFKIKSEAESLEIYAEYDRCRYDKDDFDLRIRRNDSYKEPRYINLPLKKVFSRREIRYLRKHKNLYITGFDIKKGTELYDYIVDKIDKYFSQYHLLTRNVSEDIVGSK